MPFIVRPSGSADLSSATLYNDAALPATLSGLAAGTYEVGRLVWASADVAVGAPARANRLGMSVGWDALRWLSDADLAAALDDMAAMGSAALRFDLDWSTIQAGGPGSFDWTGADRIVGGALSRGMDVLPILQFTPTWARRYPTSRTSPPTRMSDFAGFCTAAVGRYGVRGIRQWEVWNEPNLSNFWAPEPDPAGYAAMLNAAHDAIKTADPSATVISAGLAAVPTTDTQSPMRFMAVEEFLNRLYDAGARFDAMGFHPYSWPLMPGDAAPWNGWRLMTGKVRGIMQARGDAAKPVILTEFGAPTNAATGGVTEDAQEQMLLEAVGLAKSQPWAGPLYWYSYADRGRDPASTEDWFGIVRPDRSPKKARATFRAIASAKSPIAGPLFFDASGGDVTAVSNRVSRWHGSGAAACAFEAAPSPNVLFGTRKIGASYAVDVTGSGLAGPSLLQMPGATWSGIVDLTFGAMPWSLFVGCVCDGPTGTNNVIMQIGAGSSSTATDTILQLSRRADHLRVACNGHANILPAALMPYGALTTLLLTWSGTEARLSVNGAATAPLAVGTNAAQHPVWTLGSTLAAADANRFDGALAAIFAGRSVVDPSQHAALRGYVTSRWG